MFKNNKLYQMSKILTMITQKLILKNHKQFKNNRLQKHKNNKNHNNNKHNTHKQSSKHNKQLKKYQLYQIVTMKLKNLNHSKKIMK